MIEQIEARTILSKVKDDNYFGLSYNMNLYRGCQHACIYCDSRSICYQLGDLSRIRYKSNAIELLQNELSRKRIKGTIGFGSMNDPYMPVEQETGLSRKALELIAKDRFPVHLLTKSNLVLRDLDLMKEISKVYVAISFTITTADDKLAKLVEPKAPLPSLRFEAMKVLSQNNIYCGITLMPILPYINDTEENIKELINKAIDSGAQYVILFMDVTLREGSRDYFYKRLDLSFPDIKEKYIKAFGNRYVCQSPRSDLLYVTINSLMEKHGRSLKMKFYHPDTYRQLALF